MGIRSFRGRVFLALLAIGVIPSVIIVGGGAIAFRGAVDLSGTAGPWSSVAESGSDLFERIDTAGITDPALRAAVDRHAEVLETSVRYSDLYAAIARRVSENLPMVALVFFLVMALIALVVAILLSRGMASPIAELVDWTGRISRDDPLPAEGPEGERGGAIEFERLRTALRTMAGELHEGRRRAVESARLRSWTEMARRVAHEIKNPLTPIQISAAALQRDERPAVAEGAAIILDEVQRLDELARSFAQLGRMPEGPGAPVDLAELIRGLSERHRQPGIEIIVDAPDNLPLVPGHHDALVRVFRNLIANAVEATGPRPADSPAEVTAYLTSIPDAVEVHVLDRGAGFEEEVLNDLWDPEFTTKMRGTGLGLALVRSTVEAHGGTVVAANREGGGAHMTVTLPRSQGA